MVDRHGQWLGLGLMMAQARHAVQQSASGGGHWRGHGDQQSGGGLAGILVPVSLDRLRIDPAVSSAVFVTTATDVMGFFSFLGLAVLTGLA
jgi:hypothetical protein